MNILRCLVPAFAALLPVGALAIELAPRGAYVQGGVADHSAYSATVGLVWPWAWQREARKGLITGATEIYASHWNTRGVGERDSFTQLGLLPMFRYRFDHGRSDWFLEAGIGISLTDRLYETPHKQFSTRFNFVDVIGAGLSLGVDRRHELSLRVTHMSNADIKKPNPGENFLQLRYAALF